MSEANISAQRVAHTLKAPSEKPYNGYRPRYLPAKQQNKIKRELKLGWNRAETNCRLTDENFLTPDMTALCA